MEGFRQAYFRGGCGETGTGSVGSTSGYVEEIPADLADEAAEWRDKLLEGAANFDGNARTFRITAAAGTELAGPYSCGTCNKGHVPHFIPAQKRFTTHKAVFPHATWLVQAYAH